jgi:hypothetical protein
MIDKLFYSDQWLTMWQQKSQIERKILSHNIFKPILRRYHLQSNTIRITIDPRYTDRVGIQAISKIYYLIFCSVILIFV